MSLEKKKLAIICPADFIGGAELFVVDIVNEILSNPRFNKKYEIVLITQNNQNFIDKFHKDTEVFKMEFPRLKKFSFSSLRNFFKTAKNLKKIITEINPDIVLSNSIRTHLLSAKLSNKKGEIKIKKKKVALYFIVHDFTFGKFFFKRTHKKARKIFTCSQAVKKDLIKKGGKPEKIDIIYNGVKVDERKIRNFSFKAKKENDEFKIGILGRIDIWKGQDVFIESAAFLYKIIAQKKSALKPIKNYKYKFLIFGKSSNHDQKTIDFEKALQEKVKENKLENIVEFRGFTEKEKAFEEMDLMVHASSKPEPFGRVIIEAQAFGVPVIASDLGGTTEIITDGENGFLVEAGNVEKLARKIFELSQDPSLQEEMINRGFLNVIGRFRLERIVERMLKFLI